MRRWLGLAVVAAGFVGGGAAAQQMDADFASSVKGWTTKPEFSSPLVDHLPVGGAVPSPKDVLGHHIGAPKKLTYYADVRRYYDALAKASPRVKVLPIGQTEEGRETEIVFVGSEDAIAHLEENRANLAKLADPRGPNGVLSPAEAKAIEEKTKPIYFLSGGLHSAELGPPEMLMELAYRLVTEETPEIRKIRENVVVAILPVADPDGRDRSIDWYNRNKIDITDYEESTKAEVPYWGKYFKHDNNRDINYAALANQHLLAWYLEWHPPVMHDLHESVPFLYAYSGQAPQNELYDPIIYGELPMLSNWDMSQLTKMGMPGVWTHGYVDAWSPGYVAGMSTNHNGIMRFYEIFGNGGATTMHRTLGGANGGGGMGDPTKREWYRPNPPYKSFDWSMRNNTNYAETGVLNSLELVSVIGPKLLDDFYVKSRNSVDRGEKEAPFGYVIPAAQADETKVAFAVHLLRMQGIEMGRLKAEVKLSDGTYPAGSLVVKTNQPYGPLAKTLMSKQVDPDPELPTYDDSAWTLAYMTGATITATKDVAIQKAAVDPVGEFQPVGTVKEAGGAQWYAVKDFGSPNMVTLRWALKEAPVEIAEAGFKVKNDSFGAGTFLVPASQAGVLKEEVRELGLEAVALGAKPAVKTHPSPLPRVAIFSTWNGTQDVGWVRYTLDQYKVPYQLIFKERVLQGNLGRDFDVLLIPTQTRTAKQLVTDIPKTAKPMPYTKTDQFKFLGDYGSSEDITGGMGVTGVAEIQKFAEGGGTLVTMGVSSALPAEFGLIPTLDTQAPTAKLYAPGPIVQATAERPESPIFYGYATDKPLPVRYANGPLFRVPAEMNKAGEVLLRYPGGDAGVLSGLFRSADEIKGRAALVVHPVGKGEAVLFATNPIWRWQNMSEYRMLFNTLMNYKVLEPAAPARKPDTAAVVETQ